MNTTTKRVKHSYSSGQSLVHEWANFNPHALHCPASVSTCEESTNGASTLFSYSTGVAKRIRHNGQRCFAVTTINYSVTTNKHLKWLNNSIPLALSYGTHMLRSELRDLECTADSSNDFKELFSAFEKGLMETVKDKQTSLVFYVGSYVTFSYDAYKHMASNVEDMLVKINNPRASKYSFAEVMDIYSDYLMCEVFRKKFCKGEKKYKFSNIKKIIWGYICRDAKRTRDSMAEREQRLKATKAVAEYHKDTLEAFSKEYTQTMVDEAEGWREGKSWGVMSKEREDVLERLEQEIISRYKKAGYQRHEIIRAWEEISNKEFYEGTGLGRVLLRQKDDEIETSRGARLPSTLCKALFKRHKDKVLQTEKQEKVDGLPIAVGSFTWGESKDGNLQIGCHIIPASEIILLAEKLGW